MTWTELTNKVKRWTLSVGIVVVLEQICHRLDLGDDPVSALVFYGGLFLSPFLIFLSLPRWQSFVTIALIASVFTVLY